MFSTAQLDMINGLVGVMRDEGYLYYVAYSDNYRDSSSEPDLYIYFSTEEIFASDLLSYHIPRNSKLYSIRTSNGSSYNNTGERIVVSNLETSNDIVIEQNEFISTNAKFLTVAFQPDFTVKEVKTYETQAAACFLLSILVLLSCFFHFFRR
ncbi:MAG: hypothetical protein IJ262_09175 [Clostridia bacterium]|nr:hypothetical protein [Clostridia bacterium]